jgi:Pentapeptide repeats (8 copies)/WD domain, G-beta repeat
MKAVQPREGPALERAAVEHQIGSGSLLVRDAEGAFSFVHRSVLEWLVAEAAAREVRERGDSAALGADEMSDLMVDFFVSLAGREAAGSWARRVLHGAEKGHAKDNGLRVVRWLSRGEEEETVVGDDDIEVVDGVQLVGHDLSGQSLVRADLRKANLTRANLRNAVLVEARLSGATLVAAQLGRADLSGASLGGADLRGADLSFARLVGVDLTGADLTDAALRGARLVGARGIELASLAAEGAAPPRPERADPMWAQASVCHAVAWNASGDLLATAHADGSVRLWDVVSGQAVRVMAGHAGKVTCVSFSPDGRTLASGSEDKSVRLWEVHSGRALRSFEGHGLGVKSVSFSPDGRTLASGSDGQSVRLWEVHSGRAIRLFEGHKAAVTQVAFSPDDAHLASASADGTLRLWQVATGHCLAILLPCPEGWVAFTPDGRYKLGGDIAGSFWHVIGLCRFEPGELDPYLPSPLRLPADAPLLALPPADAHPTTEEPPLLGESR